MRVTAIELDRLDARPDARPLDADKVRAIVSSWGDVGQINPIRVRPRGERFEVSAGGHRCAAARALGLVEIDAVVVDEGDITAELAMIDENLCRAELTPADRARQTARRKQLYLELHPEAGHGGDRRSDQAANLATRSDGEGFTAETARATGHSERTVQRDAERGEKVAEDVLDLIRGTSLDTGMYLDDLKRLDPDTQRIVARRDLERMRARAEAKAAEAGQPVNGARAIMASRREADDSLDYFPTPPWATRALLVHVLGGVLGTGLAGMEVREPACGEGHIAGVLAEFGARVTATDIFDYGQDDGDVRRSAPGWAGALDWLGAEVEGLAADWVITNPPFGGRELDFILKALDRATVGVATFLRSQWIEGSSRYEALFSRRPPAIVAQFAERVPLVSGRWDPEAVSATAYCWMVWLAEPTAPGATRLVWIPPGCRVALSRADDATRYTAHPVLAPDDPWLERFMPSADDFIRAGYARGMSPTVLADVTGLLPGTVSKRAQRMGLTGLMGNQKMEHGDDR